MVLFCKGGVTVAKKRCFKEKIVARRSNVSSLEREDNRQVILGFNNMESLLTAIRVGLVAWQEWKPSVVERGDNVRRGMEAATMISQEVCHAG